MIKIAACNSLCGVDSESHQPFGQSVNIGMRVDGFEILLFALRRVIYFA